MAFLDRIFILCALITLSVSHSVASADLSGYWRTFDDVTGYAKSIVQITKDRNNLYSAKVVKVIPIPGYTPTVTCQKCPEPFTNKKILGLVIVWNLHVDLDAGEKASYKNGYAIDPLSGKIYQAHVTINNDDRSLRLRGSVIGAPMIGRSQTWRRESNYQD